MRLALHQLRYELRAFWRTPAGVFFTFALPVLMLVVFSTLNEGDRLADGRRFTSYFVPGMLAFGTASAAYGNLSARTVVRRESGHLKRLRATPLPAATYLAGAIGCAVLTVLAVSATVLAVGRLAYDVPLPVDTPATAGWILVGAASFAALGLALSTVVTSSEAADPTVFGTLIPVVFISGVFDPVPDGSVLDRIAAVFPVQHLRAALDDAAVGAAVDLTHVAVLVLWGVAGALVAGRRFRWTPS